MRNRNQSGGSYANRGFDATTQASSNNLAKNGGDFVNGVDLSGRQYTKIPYFNGDIYEGQVLNDKKDGEGVYYCANKEKRTNYEYHGMWREGVREGHGKCYYYNEDLYVGDWKADKRHGFGELFTRKQERYKGMWKNNMKDGKGTLTSHNGTIFTGRWFQDKKHGEGEL